MSEFYAGTYPAVVKGTEWITSSKKGTLGLKVDVDVENAIGETKAMTGFVWCSEKTVQPQERKDGTKGRSMVERQLNALGYDGPFNEASNIGVSVDITGNETFVLLKEEEYEGEVRLKVSMFVTGSNKADPDAVKKLFSGVTQAEPRAPRTKPTDSEEFDDLSGSEDIPF